MAEEKLKFAILGYGSIGQRHYKNLDEMGYRVSYYDPLCPGIYTREEIIDWADAVLVCTPTGNHFQDMVDVVDAGKHCFVEKPIGYDCPELFDGYMQGARSRWLDRVIIATGFNLRFHECVAKAKAILNDHGLGEILTASFSVLQKNDKPEYLRDGVIRNWACHEIDLAMYLLGRMEVVEAYAEQNSEGKDQTSCTITMRREGIRGIITINADYTTDPQQRFFWIKGKLGTLYVNLLERTLFVDWADKRKTCREFRGTGSFDKDYQKEMLCFANSCKTLIPMEPLALAEEGVTNLYAIMKARELARVL
jgi:predicted dehydrogenase